MPSRVDLSSHAGSSQAKESSAHGTRIMCIECKRHGDSGGARVGRVTFSKTGRTIRYRGLVLKPLRGSGIRGNYMDEKSGFEYGVSGPKKNGQDRHWAGGGPVRIDADVVDEYLEAESRLRSAEESVSRVTTPRIINPQLEHSRFSAGRRGGRPAGSCRRAWCARGGRESRPAPCHWRCGSGGRSLA